MTRPEIPTNVPNIFILTVFYLIDPQKPATHTRSWGWFPSFELAEDTVMTNDGDIYEDGYYNLAVIEEVSWGSLAMSEPRQWYRVEHKGDANYVITKIDVPEVYERAIGFALG